MISLILFNILSETEITFFVVLEIGGGKRNKKKGGAHPAHLSFVELLLSSAEAAQEVLVQTYQKFFFSLTNYCSVFDLIPVSNFMWNVELIFSH